jgi:hypothetical protein
VNQRILTKVLDDRLFERYATAHNLDGDEPSTRLAIAVVKSAERNGHPDDPSAATRALTGATGALGVQGTMGSEFVPAAIEHDKAAEQEASTADEHAADALAAAKERTDLPNKFVQLADGTNRTRGQVQTEHDRRQQQAARREGRGDTEHLARQPDPVVAWVIAVITGVLEAFLLLWPVTNASFGNPKSVLAFTCLVALLVVANEALPKRAGHTHPAALATWVTDPGATSAPDPLGAGCPLVTASGASGGIYRNSAPRGSGSGTPVPSVSPTLRRSQAEVDQVHSFRVPTHLCSTLSESAGRHGSCVFIRAAPATSWQWPGQPGS